VVTLDAAAFEPDIFGSLSLPCVAWFVDNPLYFLERLRPDDWLMPVSWDDGYQDDFNRLGFAEVPHLPLATNPERFTAAGGAGETDDRYRHPVSFIGTLGSYPGRSAEADALNPAIRDLLGRVVQVVVASPGIGIREALNNLFPAAVTHFDSLPLDQWASLEIWVDQEAGYLLRKQSVERLARFGITVYGDEAWRTVLPEAAVYAGKADYEVTAPAVYRSSAISLNLTRPQLRSTVNQRLFDVAAAGGFVLTDYRPDLETLFDLGTEVAAFRSLEEMEELAEFYLNNPGERSAKGEKARRRVLEQHTYLHRARRMVELVRDRYGI
jgi:spore maturation protein CgeB